VKKKVILIIVVIVVVLAINGKGLLDKRKAEITNESLPIQNSISVKVVTPKQGVLQNRVTYLAKIESDKDIKLSTKLAGYIQKVLVEESQMVKKDEVLVYIDSTELKSNIEALNSTLNAQKNDLQLAKSIYNRNLKLYKVGGLAKEKLDISLVALQSKGSMVENTKQKIIQLNHELSYLTIVAPFNGYINNILLHEGDLVALGKPILSMINDKKKLLFSYAFTKSTKIAKNQQVLLDNKNIGSIRAIYSTSKNGLLQAEVQLSERIDLPSGSSINIEVVTKEAKGCIVPNNTILHKKDGEFVMEYKNSRFIPFKVSIDIKEGNDILINPCPKSDIASASEVKLANLLAYDRVNIVGAKGE